MLIESPRMRAEREADEIIERMKLKPDHEWTLCRHLLVRAIQAAYGRGWSDGARS